MGNKLYVGGLPYSVTDGRLQEIFTEHGTVESRCVSRIVYRPITGLRLRRNDSGSAAQKAIDALNGTQLDGRT